MKRWLIAAVAIAALSTPGLAQAAPTVRYANATSTNWSGYIASGSGQSFSDVRGSWVQPAVTCTARSTTFSSFWVGLGGASSSANGLEQIGTDSDCRNGSPVYSAWYELIPAPSVAVPLTVSPGDTMNAEVTVAGTQVTLTLTDATTAQTFTTTVTVATPDTSSAEWIAEAPSECVGASTMNCRVQPLASFGTASFSSASATANGDTGVISDAAWTGTPVDLRGTAGGASATTGALGADGASFAVTAGAGTPAVSPTPRPTPPRVIPRWWHPPHHNR